MSIVGRQHQVMENIEKAGEILSSRRKQRVDDESDRKEGVQGERSDDTFFHLCMMCSYSFNVLPLHSVARQFQKRGQCQPYPWLLSFLQFKGRTVSVITYIRNCTNRKQAA